MSKLFYVLALASAVMFTPAQQTAVPNFAGTWSLDKSKSQGLSAAYRSFEQSVWQITQTENEISIHETFFDFAVKNLPPARSATGGGNEPIGPATYKLDGSETTKNIGRSKYLRKAVLSKDGKTLELVERIISQGTDGEVASTRTDTLSLSADGKVLTVFRRKEDSPGPKESTLVFNQ
jgi:hypothetical protein